MRSMIRLMPTLNSACRLAVLHVSLPRVDALLDQPQRYVLEENLPQRDSKDFRRMRQDKEPPTRAQTLTRLRLATARTCRTGLLSPRR
jgi:hypothetical protein